MIKDTWDEVGRLENIFLEIVEDPTKKEILLYPICYCQLVRKENSFEIALHKLIACANKTFHSFKGKWQDILLELNLFMFIMPNGDVLLSKDILRVQSPDGIKVSFLPEYREVFYEVYSRFLKYWSVLSKISSYSKRNTPSEAVYLSSLIFNEELFSENVHFTNTQSFRFPKDRVFFDALNKLSRFYSTYQEKKEILTDLLEETRSLIEPLEDNYYGINLRKLKRDLELLQKEITRGRVVFTVKIEFSLVAGHGKGFLKRLLSGIVSKLKALGGKRWTLMNSETGYFSFTEIYLRRQRDRRIPA